MAPLAQAGRVEAGATMREAVLEMSAHRGIVAVVDADWHLLGVVTNGDLMRLMRTERDVFEIPMARIMSCEPQVCAAEDLAAAVVGRMETRGIVSMPVLERVSGPLVGMVHLHDCMRAGVV